MAKSNPQTRRRSNARSNGRRRNRRNLFGFGGSKRRRRSNPFYSHRRRSNRRNSYALRGNRHHRRHGYRRNPAPGSIAETLLIGGYVAAGAVGSRLLTQFVLGTGNTGVVGYAGNGVATMLMSWVAGKFASRQAAQYVVAGGVAGLILRILQDQTPIGQYFNLSGVDSGMGAIVPANFTQPAIYTGQNAMVRVPNGWGGTQLVPAAAAAPAVAAAANAARRPGSVQPTGVSGMGAPVGRGHYSTGGGRGLYRAA